MSDRVILFGPLSNLFVRSKLYSLSVEIDEESGMMVTIKANVTSKVLPFTLDVLMLSIIIFMLYAKNRVFDNIISKFSLLCHNTLATTNYEILHIISS